jgi:hypothetical protein
MKTGKRSKLLPGRSDLKQLAKSPRTIADYSKLSPVNTPTAPVIQNLRLPKRG